VKWILFWIAIGFFLTGTAHWIVGHPKGQAVGYWLIAVIAMGAAFYAPHLQGAIGR
jgi:hypothetical protein